MRPNLTPNLMESTFREYYYLKEESESFCESNGLPSGGSKEELTERIAYFLSTGKILPESEPEERNANYDEVTEDSVIKEGYVCTETDRAFFKSVLGDSFRFLVPFQKWMKSNAGKTYKDAIIAYSEILEKKNRGEYEIGKQFEYNRYIHDFFADSTNEGVSLRTAIECWKYKKNLPGSHAYEPSDLVQVVRSVEG